MTRKAPAIRYLCLPDAEIRNLPQANRTLLERLGEQSHEIVRLPKFTSLEATLESLLKLNKPSPDTTTIVLSPLCSSMQRMAVQLLAASGLLETWHLCRWDPSQQPQKLPKPVTLLRSNSATEHPLAWNRKLNSPLKRIGLRWMMQREFDTTRFRDLKPMADRIGHDLDGLWLLHPKDTKAVGAAERIKTLFPKIRCCQVAIEHEDGLSQGEQGTILQEIRATMKSLAESHQDHRMEFLIDFTTGHEEIKAAMMSLALSGELPGRWIIGGGKDNEIDPAGLQILIDAQNTKRDQVLDECLEMHLHDSTHNESLKAMRRAILIAAGVSKKAAGDSKTQDSVKDASPACPSDPILLQGPTGSGKTFLVKALAKMKGVQQGKFHHLNCSEFAGDPNIMLSRLFGHVKDAYTGATKDFKGAFEEADGGILFLDEIGEMPLDAQARLLTALDREENGYRFTPLGTTVSRQSNFTLLCGTNRDLGLLVEEKRFREDLHHRIRTRSFQLPSLQERLKGTAAKLREKEALGLLERSWGKQMPFVDAAAEKALVKTILSRDWSGNFREFQSWAVSLLDRVQFGRLTATAVEECNMAEPKPSATKGSKEPVQKEIRTMLEQSVGNNSLLYRLAVESGLQSPVKKGGESETGKRLREKWEQAIKPREP